MHAHRVCTRVFNNNNSRCYFLFCDAPCNALWILKRGHQSAFHNCERRTRQCCFIRSFRFCRFVKCGKLVALLAFDRGPYRGADNNQILVFLRKKPLKRAFPVNASCVITPALSLGCKARGLWGFIGPGLFALRCYEKMATTWTSPPSTQRTPQKSTATVSPHKFDGRNKLNPSTPVETRTPGSCA